ncbi:hypothetical protein KSS87_012613 [Heliosperma pusillum]|nr:hypothetical protein KSS87_012613 [Heliosperma pusillum]
MDLSGCSNYEQDTLVSELTQGMELANQLKAHMGVQGGSGMLAEKIHASFEKALLILKWSGSMEQSYQNVVPSSTIPASPISVAGSPKSSEDLNQGFANQQDSKDFSKKRKKMPSWTDQVKVNEENTVEGPPHDGHSWRKYGQKDILGAKYPRSYYRCTYRTLQGCCAIKQVQRNDEDPLLFDITYKGTHTCAPRSKSAPTSPEKQERMKQNQFPITVYQQQSDMLLNFQTGLSIDIQNLENQELDLPFPTNGSVYENHTFTPSTPNDNFYSSFPPSFTVSPATSTSNYFSTSPCNMSPFGGVHHGQHSESEFAEIFSANTSGTNSPIIGLDFSLERLEFNPPFLYGNQAYP